MKKRLTTIILLSVAGGVLAQAPSQPPVTPPNLTASMATALNALQAQQKQLQQGERDLDNVIQAVAQEFRQQYPGYHLVSQPVVQIVKDAPASVPATKAAPQPSPTPNSKKK